MALERLTYDAGAKQVTYRSDKAEGPTAGPETADPLEFLARVLTHIPDKGQVRFDLSRFRGEARFSLEARLDSARVRTSPSGRSTQAGALCHPGLEYKDHGARRPMLHLSPSRTYMIRSCSRLARPCQNSMRSGTSL